MGRETVLFPVTWDEGEWPKAEPVRGHMVGSSPPENKGIPGTGNWVSAGDACDFEPGSRLSRHFVHYRPPPNREEYYKVSLQLRLSLCFFLTHLRAKAIMCIQSHSLCVIAT